MKNKVSDSDKKLLSRTGLATIDALVIAIDTSLGGTPFASGAWVLAKALLGNGLALRQKKTIEWVEMIRYNPSVFTKEIVETEEFQDAFIISLENYIKERNKDKRRILREIFKNYSLSKDPLDYPLERLNEITKQITLFDAKNFSYLKHLSTDQKSGRSFQDTRDTQTHIESVLHLISLGLLINDDRPRTIREKSGVEHPYVYISGLGSHFYDFIKEAELIKGEFEN